jgi:hypothetical protein
VLRTFGYAVETEYAPRRREVLYGMGQLTRAILNTLRVSDKPLAPRELARVILIGDGLDPQDRKLLDEHTRRVSKTLWGLKVRGLAHASKDDDRKTVWASASAC